MENMPLVLVQYGTRRRVPAGRDADVVAAAVKERLGRVAEPSVQVVQKLLGELLEKGLAGQLEHVQDVAQQAGMVGQKLLVVGLAPVPLRRVAEETALGIMGLALVHRVEGEPDVVEVARVAGGLVTLQ